ncbi:MAG: TIGR02611 family protein [Micromonosporaceae bacterium]|nr:TIGR02611 family protein [Micromonosporaceae bacterium]
MERAAEGIVRDATRKIGWLDWVRGVASGLRRRIRSTAAGRITLKVVVAVLGVSTVLLGIAMIPLPGPGWLVVFFGLAILSIEYVWAKHVLRFGRERLKTWTHWVGEQSWWTRLAIGALGLIFVGAMLWLAVRNSFGIDLAQSFWHFLTSQ